MSKNKLSKSCGDVLNRNNFLEALKPKIVFKTIPDLGTVGISILSLADRLQLIELQNQAENDAVQKQETTLKLLALVLTDSAGEKLLNINDLDTLKQGNAKLLDELTLAALEVNGMTKQSVDTLEKNSDPALSD